MPKQALLFDERDNVVTTLAPLEVGEAVTVVGRDGIPVTRLRAREHIDVYHKLALRDICDHETVMKYGETIGMATCYIPEGSHVHVHNVIGPKVGHHA